MDKKLNLGLYSFTIDCREPNALAKFYTALLGWKVVYSDEDYVCIAPSGVAQGAYPGITFQRNPQYDPPVWPDRPEAQQQMAHLDVAVDDLEKAAAHAVACGAVVAEAQFAAHLRVMLDPAGHPFCLCLLPHLFPTAD